MTNGNVKDKNHKGNFLFPMKDFVSFRTNLQSMYFMSTIILKDNINGFRITNFQLACIRNTPHPSHKNLVTLCHDVHYMWKVNRHLKVQEWYDFIT